MLARLPLLLALLLPGLHGDALAHDGSVPIRSSLREAGRLVLDPGSFGPFVAVPSACASGTCLYTSAGLSFSTPSSDAGEEGPFALKMATVVKLEIVSVDAGAAIKNGSNVLDVAGENSTLGAAWSLHADTVLQATATEGVEKEWTIVARLTSSRYEPSDPFSIVLRNFEAVSTTTSTTSTTTTLAAECGDGVVDLPEACDRGSEPWAAGSACSADCGFLACGDPDGNAKRTAGDALFVLRAAVGSRTCDACLCNVDGSATGAAVNVSDALRLLRVSVGAPGAVLACPACS